MKDSIAHPDRLTFSVLLWTATKKQRQLEEKKKEKAAGTPPGGEEGHEDAQLEEVGVVEERDAGVVDAGHVEQVELRSTKIQRYWCSEGFLTEHFTADQAPVSIGS
ncbi:hypothetical protein AYL99_11986 [Fonsecaea erecta]|uniref:Uncharacterized protein n=1 Tax=Fonsecaea erecta TaxID=1367422 RepID=A0A178Z1X2_9EURO|nr:hypothetical protein AYL99_11986 [Fonsecaea erecta]OAP53800.1 hypothetical protein AYL99_11986 [Fonsecaea erecta]